MAFSSNVGGTTQFPISGYYTGYNIHATFGSRTVENENIKLGDVLQIEPAALALNIVPLNADQERTALSVPTTGFGTPLVVVADSNTQQTLADINTIDTAIANKRVGGTLVVQATGRIKARVQGATVAGVTLLAVTAGQKHLVPVTGFVTGLWGRQTFADAAVVSAAQDTANAVVVTIPFSVGTNSVPLASISVRVYATSTGVEYVTGLGVTRTTPTSVTIVGTDLLAAQSWDIIVVGTTDVRVLAVAEETGTFDGATYDGTETAPVCLVHILQNGVV